MRLTILGPQLAVLGLTLAFRAVAAPTLYEFAPDGVPITLPDGQVVNAHATFVYDPGQPDVVALPEGGTGYGGVFNRLVARIGPETAQDPLGGVGVFNDNLVINDVPQDGVVLIADPASLPGDLQGFTLSGPTSHTLVNVLLVWNEALVGEFLDDESLPPSLPPLPANAVLSLEFAIDGNPQNLTSVAAIGPVVARNEVLANLVLRDAEGSGDPEAVVVRNFSTQAIAEVRDYGTGTGISSLASTPGYPPVDAALVQHFAGTAADELAMLVYDPDRDRPLVELRDTLSDELLTRVPFYRAHEPIALAVLPDLSGNPAGALAVLATRRADGRPRVLLRDLATGEPLPTLSLPQGFTVSDLLATPDFSGNASAEVVVLARRTRDDKGYALVWDSGGAGWLANVPVPRGYTPLDLGFAYGPGELPGVAILTRREASGTARLYFNDALTGARFWSRGWNRAPVALDTLILPAETDGIAVLTERLTDQAQILSLMESDTNAIGANVPFGSGVTGLDFVVLPDLSVDPGTDPELSALVRTAAGLELRVRDAVTKDLIQTIPIP